MELNVSRKRKNVQNDTTAADDLANRKLEGSWKIAG